jgi:DNA-binding NarL/FixJ family response regulator
MMPQVSGLDILPRIREQLPDTRILLVTGSEDHETLRCCGSGIDGFIMKPFRARHITEAVSKVIPGLTSGRYAIVSSHC